MQPYPWDLADPRKRPKRLAKKLKARLNWRRFPPRELKASLAVAVAQARSPHPEILCYVPTRRGARKAAHIYEGSMAIGSRWKIERKDCVGPVRVSTVFLCFDHVFSLDGGSHRPVLWETMCFLEDYDICDADTFRDMGYGPEEVDYLGQEQWRYTSREDAVSHHVKLVGMLRSGLN